MTKKVTIYDIAKKLNLTGATVSRALSNNPKISAATRELVIKTAKEMDYRPNRLALALKSGKSQTIAVIVPRINRVFFSTIIKSIEDELSMHGYHVIICQTYDTKAKETENIDTLLNLQIGGILMSISNAMNKNGSKEVDQINRILEKNVPLIFFDRKKDINGVSSVTIDDYQGGYIATQHLIDQGCKKIAFLSGDQFLEIYKERFRGYKQALIDNDISFRDDFAFEVENSIEAGKKAINILMKLKNPPDAVFATSDDVALGAIQELNSKGIQVPEKVCVSGFSNETFTEHMGITSVDQFPLEMGKIAAEIFLEQATANSQVKTEKKVVITPKLHIRKSTSKKISK